MGGAKRRGQTGGGALITALVFVLILTLVVGAIGRLSAGHFSRTTRESDYSKALMLADAGANYELRYISQNQLTDTPAHQADEPFSGSISGIDGTFQVWVTNDPDNGADWQPPYPMILNAIGTVNGISRQIQARGVRQSLFDAFATFGYISVTMGGTNTVVNGDLGSNGTIALNGGTPGVSSGYDIYLAGPDAGGVSGSNVIVTPNRVELPSIDPDIIEKPATYGFGTTNWDTISSYRQNASMRQFASSGAALTAAGTQSAGWPSSGSAATEIKGNSFNSLQTGPISVITDSAGTKRLVAPGTAGSTVENVKALILPTLSTTAPTDYYFTQFDASGGSNVIIIDNAGWTSTGTKGTVRIWVGPSGGTSKDNIRINVYFTEADPTYFRLYYAKCSDITIAGNSVWYGGIYAVQKSCSGTPAVKITGGSKIYGSVIANYIEMSGGSQINFPANGVIDNPADFSLWFGFKNEWKEVAIGGGGVFYDGTNR